MTAEVSGGIFLRLSRPRDKCLAGTLQPSPAEDSANASGAWLLRSAVGDPGGVRCWVASYTVNQHGNTVKLRPRLMGSEDSSRPELLVAKVRNVRLAVSRCYEDPVLVDQHDHIVQARARKASTSLRTTVARS